MLFRSILQGGSLSNYCHGKSGATLFVVSVALGTGKNKGVSKLTVSSVREERLVIRSPTQCWVVECVANQFGIIHNDQGSSSSLVSGAPLAGLSISENFLYAKVERYLGRFVCSASQLRLSDNDNKLPVNRERLSSYSVSSNPVTKPPCRSTILASALLFSVLPLSCGVPLYLGYCVFHLAHYFDQDFSECVLVSNQKVSHGQ